LLYCLGLLGKHGRDGLPGLSGEKGKTFRNVVYFYSVIQPNHFKHVVETIILYKQYNKWINNKWGTWYLHVILIM